MNYEVKKIGIVRHLSIGFEEENIKIVSLGSALPSRLGLRSTSVSQYSVATLEQQCRFESRSGLLLWPIAMAPSSVQHPRTAACVLRAAVVEVGSVTRPAGHLLPIRRAVAA